MEKSSALHIGIIMDGNGRWGTNHGLSRIKGHSAGAKRVKELVTHADETGIASLTIWAYSTDNWKRNAKEVTALMLLFNAYIDRESAELHQKNVKVSFIGDRTVLPEKLQLAMMRLEEKTKDNGGLVLQVALNYSGSDELVRAFSKLKEEDAEITQESIDAALDTGGTPNPDIVIRTGMPPSEGKLSQWRSSGFMPMQSIQSVCVSTEVLWPDFTPEHFQEIITYAKPESRLFGGQRE